MTPLRSFVFRQVNRARVRVLNLYFNPRYPDRVRAFGNWAGDRLGDVLDWLEKPDVDASLAPMEQVVARAEAVREQFEAIQSEVGHPDHPDYLLRLGERCMSVLVSVEPEEYGPREEAARILLDGVIEAE